MADSPTTIRLRGIADGVEEVVFTADTITSLEVAHRFLGENAKVVFPNSYDKVTSIEVLGKVNRLVIEDFSDENYTPIFPALRSLKINYVKVVDDGAVFKYEHLEKLVLGYVEEIKGGAFQYIGALDEVTIPPSLATVGYEAFGGDAYTPPITKVIISDIPKWCSIDFAGEWSNPAYISGNLGRMVENTYTPITALSAPDFGSIEEIKPYTFNGNTSLVSVALPSNVKTIGHDSFTNCTSMTSLTLPEGLETIEDNAFAGCTGLSNISLPSSLESLGTNAFPSSAYVYDEDGLAIFNGFLVGIKDDKENVTIPNTVRGLANGVAANHGKLKTVSIPSTVTEIPLSCFSGCSSLTSVTFLGSITAIGDSAFSGCSSLASISLPDSVTSIGTSAFEGCSALAGITTGPNLVSIGDFAFSACTSLSSVTLGNGLEHIGEGAFSSGRYSSSDEGAPITRLVFPSSMRTVGRSAFLYCGDLEELVLNEGLQSIGDYSFSVCASLKSVTIPDTVTYLGYDAFSEDTALTSVVIGNGVTELKGGVGAFAYCESLTSVTFGTGLRRVGLSSFNGCDNISTVRIRSLSAWIGVDFAHYNDNPIRLTHKFYVGDSGTTYPSTTLTVPNGTTHIGQYAFYGWNDAEYGVSSVVFEGGGVSVGDGAFSECTMLTSVSCPSVQDWMTISFGTDSSNPNRYASNLQIGGSPVTSLTIPSGTSEIHAYAFYNCTALASVTFEGDGIAIGADAFYGCSSLSDVYSTTLDAWMAMRFTTINSNPTSIGHNLIIGGNVLEQAVISPSISTIRKFAFANCTGLSSIVISSSDTDFEGDAFIGCTGLTEFDYPSLEKWLSLTFVKESDNPIYYSGNLKIGGYPISSLSVPNGTASIHKYAFVNCRGLSSVSIPGTCKTIEDEAFNNCGGIMILSLAEGIEKIGNSAFRGCSNIRNSLTIPDSVLEIGEYAFSDTSRNSPDLFVGKNVGSVGRSAFAWSEPHFYNSVVFRGNCPTTIGYMIFGGRIGRPGYNWFYIHVPSDSSGWERITSTYTTVRVEYDQPPIS